MPGCSVHQPGVCSHTQAPAKEGMRRSARVRAPTAALRDSMEQQEGPGEEAVEEASKTPSKEMLDSSAPEAAEENAAQDQGGGRPGGTANKGKRSVRRPRTVTHGTEGGELQTAVKSGGAMDCQPARVQQGALWLFLLVVLALFDCLQARVARLQKHASQTV